MSQEESVTSQAQESLSDVDCSSLTSQDVGRLTVYKWRYALESRGFTARQAARLLFLRWLVNQGGLQG